MKAIHIYDIDGTLVDSAHRYKTLDNGKKTTIDLQHWRDNESLFYNDNMLPLSEQYKEMRADPEVYTIWITARTAKHLTESFSWLVSHLGEPDKWFCRPNGSMESGALLKVRQLKTLFNLKQFHNVTKYFYEDNRDYLDAVCFATNAIPVYVPSTQGY